MQQLGGVILDLSRLAQAVASILKLHWTMTTMQWSGKSHLLVFFKLLTV